MWRRMTTILMILLVLTRQAEAFLGFGDIVYDPAVHFQMILQVAQAIETVRNQITQIQDMVRNTKNQKGQWSANRMVALSNQLNGTLSQGLALSRQFGNLRSQFEQRYPGMFTPQGAALYGQQQQGVLDTIANALQAGDQITRHLQGVHTLLNALALVTDSAGGRMQALQSIANIAETTATNISLLTQQTQILQEAQLQYYAAKQSQEMQTLGLGNVWVTNGIATVPTASEGGWTLPRPIQ